MPKIVDRAERTERVIDAAFAVIAREGLGAATLANIATEANLAIGSVRHYFAGHDELVAFAAEALSTRIGVRLRRRAAALAAGPVERRVEDAVDLLLEVLPLDDRRRLETSVWLEFAVAGRTDPRFTGHARRLHDELRTLVTVLLTSGRDGGRLRSDLDLGIEAVRLHALVDGLAVHGVLYEAQGGDDEVSRAVISTHLASLRAAG